MLRFYLMLFCLCDFNNNNNNKTIYKAP